MKEWQDRLHEAERHGERLIDLAAVAAWVNQQMSLWETRGHAVELFPITHGLPKNSLRFNIDTDTTVSTTVIWDSGEWEVTVGHISAEQTETSEYQPAVSTEEVIAKV